MNSDRPLWFRAQTISGRSGGLGFQCPDCHLGYRHSAPAKIQHCGRVENAPKFTLLLPSFPIVETALPSNLIPVGWHGDDGWAKKDDEQ